MASDPKEQLAVLESAETTEETGEKREVYLRDGRTLSVSSVGRDELVEIRASSGLLELRIKLTDQGPVLQMEAVRMELKASEAVEVEARAFTVKTDDKITLETKGEVEVAADGEIRINGEKIWLN